jgi:hypothetical protein
MAQHRFATEPVVADLDNDGKAEVILASWTRKGSHHTGRRLLRWPILTATANWR